MPEVSLNQRIRPRRFWGKGRENIEKQKKVDRVRGSLSLKGEGASGMSGKVRGKVSDDQSAKGAIAHHYPLFGERLLT